MSSLHPSHDAAAVPAPVCRATHVDELGVVALLQVVQHRSVVQVGQVGHVLALLKLGRVHLLQRRLLELLLLRAEVRAAGHERNVRAAGHERRSEQLVTSGGQSSWSRAECQSSWSRAEVRAAGHEQRSEQLVTRRMSDMGVRNGGQNITFRRLIPALKVKCYIYLAIKTRVLRIRLMTLELLS